MTIHLLRILTLWKAHKAQCEICAKAKAGGPLCREGRELLLSLFDL